MFYEWVNNSRCLGISLSKVLPGGWINSENRTCPSTSSSSFSLDFRITALVTAIFSILVIRSILQWIIKYKLQYLFRISCFTLICHTLILLFSATEYSLDFHIISFFFPTRQDSKVSFFFSQKSFLILPATFCFIMGIIRYHWALPINIIKDSSNVGFSHLEHIAKSRRRTVRDLSSKMLKHREPGDLNPVYVNGWIPLIDSRSVVKGRAETIIAVGYKFCVYRGEDGQVFVMDAYCPHMGADLSAGGKIVGNCIECPFHGWQFDGKTGKCTKIPYTRKSINSRRNRQRLLYFQQNFCVYRGEDGQVFVMDSYCPHIVGKCIECPFHGWQFDGKTGKCTKIPYTGKIPDIASVKVWDSCERNGYIFVWHHAENEPPTWELPSVPEIENGKWLYRGRSEFTVHCHIQEIPENGADIAHLPQVHSRFLFFGPETPGAEWIKHDWEPQWSPDEKEPHIARVKIVQRLVIWGHELPYSRINVDIQQIGPATVYLYMDSAFGKGILLQYITTEGPILQRVVQELYTEYKFKPGPASFLIWGEATMIERDIAVWNNKKYLRNPLLVKEDKLILRFRRWFSQFYSEHSPTLKDLRQKTLDW